MGSVICAGFFFLFCRICEVEMSRIGLGIMSRLSVIVCTGIFESKWQGMLARGRRGWMGEGATGRRCLEINKILAPCEDRQWNTGLALVYMCLFIWRGARVHSRSLCPTLPRVHVWTESTKCTLQAYRNDMRENPCGRHIKNADMPIV